MLNGLDLFSGIGGLSLALKPWVRTVAYCEQNAYAQGVLVSRMQDNQLCPAPIWDDIRTLNGTVFRGRIDIMFGGFPCQDISTAGIGGGLDGKRSGLFFEVMRLAKEIQPKFIFLENVPAIRTRGLDRVINELSASGYDCRWTMLSAASVGALHMRKRWFLLANANSVSIRDEQGRVSGAQRQSKTKLGNHGAQKSLDDSASLGSCREIRDLFGENAAASRRQTKHKNKTSELRTASETASVLANASRKRLEKFQQSEQGEQSPSLRTSFWQFEPSVGRVVNGVPHRVDRIKCLGNAVVPLQAQAAFTYLMGF